MSRKNHGLTLKYEPFFCDRGKYLHDLAEDLSKIEKDRKVPQMKKNNRCIIL